MVGIVIVSHSALLAAGVQELAMQMVPNNLPLATAAGIDDPQNPLGTDVMAIMEAIASIYSEDGVLVLMDLGSAVLSAEMAWELLPIEQQAKVKLCEAPLVEGTIAAVVQAAAGASLDEVMAEAQNALRAKASQLSAQEYSSSVVTEVEASPQAIRESEGITQAIQLTIDNSMGLHARPAAKFVTTSSQFQAQITLQNLTKGTPAVNGKSINQVVTLGITQGDEITISATGSDADAALSALQQLVDNNFGESDSHSRPVQQQFSTPNVEKCLPKDAHRRVSTNEHSRSNQLSGIPVSPGIVIAPIALYQLSLQVELQPAEHPDKEWENLQTALLTSKSEIEAIRQQTAAVAGEAEAAIFDAHLLCLSDPMLLDATRLQIFSQQKSAAAAWKGVIDETIVTYQGLEDTYLQARAADVSDVGQRVLGQLMGMTTPTLELSKATILVAQDLSPSQIAQLDVTKVVGICTATGSATSHAGILARSLGIPTVMGVGSDLSHLEDGTLIALNGETGQVWLEPDTSQIQELEALRDNQIATAQALQTAAQQPAHTRDGHLIKVMANIGGVADAKTAQSHGADGVGLLRSEFLYFDREQAPTETEQLEIYQAIAKATFPHPVTIRTLDVGGDKPLTYLNSVSQSNPFLGWRGIRILLDCPELFQTQLRAILRASYGHHLKILLPMVTSVGEIRAAKQLICQVQSDLQQAKIPFNETIEIGIMVEVPAAVIVAEQLAAEVDFFSIGTNDLSQYVMAADRTNTQVSALADAFEPAVLRMIQQTVNAAHQAGIAVSVCGELAAEILAIPVLLGLGVDELSMSSPAIPNIKATLAQWTMAEAQAIAQQVLQLESAEAVKEYLSFVIGH